MLGEDGADTLTGNAGVDGLFGGEGPDRLNADDATKDHVSCGSSGDTADRDGFDVVDGDCESLI